MTIERAVRNRLPELAAKISVLNSSSAWFANNANFEIEQSEFWPDDQTYKQVKFTGPVVININSVQLVAEDHLQPIELTFAAKMQSGEPSR